MKFFNLILIFLLAISCQKNKNDSNYEVIPTSETAKFENEDDYNLLKTSCYSCHTPNGNEQDRAAPPMIAVKAHYLEAYKSRDVFIDAMVNFLSSPSIDKSVMPEAVKRFNLMPKLPNNENELKRIAAFIYDYKIESPDWFQEHYKAKTGIHFEQSGKTIPIMASNQEELFQNYALETKQLLGKNLQKKIKDEGVLNALSFCNVQALPLTKTVGDKHNLEIKRVSDKPRNPLNKASDEELKIINDYNLQLQNGETPNGKMINNTYYMPIVTNDMCLKCHGDKTKDIQPNVAQNITKLYPHDMATGYKINELRGIFVVKEK